MTEAQAKRLAQRAIDSILNEGLAASTWRDNNEGAWRELFHYKEDLVLSVQKALLKTPRPRKLVDREPRLKKAR